MFSNAQDFSGTAHYQSVSNVTTTIATADASAEEQAALNAMIRKSMQKEYRLDFNKTESMFAEIPKLDAPDSGKSIEVLGLGSDAAGGLYKDISGQRMLESRDGFGKLFLVDDALEKFDWVPEDETRQVGDYLCHKATATTTKKQMQNILTDKGEIAQGEVMVTTTITAWYTTQIPVSQGPARYWGLPGLILEVNDGMLTFICSSIELRPDGGVQIKKPKKGKKVDRITFNEIYQQKVREFEERMIDQRKKSE